MRRTPDDAAGNVLATTITNDLDICYGRDAANLKALANALADLDVKRRGTSRDVPFRADARMLKKGDHLTFTTSATSSSTAESCEAGTVSLPA